MLRPIKAALLAAAALALAGPAIAQDTLKKIKDTGTITVGHDGRYGDLSGKAVALEPATGFSFDSPMGYRPR